MPKQLLQEAEHLQLMELVLGYRNGANGGGVTIYGGFFEGDDGGATDGTFKTMSNSTKEQSSVCFAAKGGLWVVGLKAKYMV